MRTSASNLCAFIAAAGAFGFATAASASTPRATEPLQVTVQFGDLDLSTDRDVATLYRRIEHAAHQACGDSRQPRGVRQAALWNDCVDSAITNAVERADRPQLTTLHRARTGHRSA